MRYRKYLARNIAVLHLNYRPDPSGDVLPPEMHAAFKNPVPVIYDHDYGRIIGKAYLMRVQDTIVADLHVLSAVEDEDEAEALVRLMYPSVSARTNARSEDVVLGIEITAISLSFNKNVDKFITPLGRRVARERRRPL